jgi:MFS transporter, PAT family, beta-lactamase induction signal transducer AmpG
MTQHLPNPSGPSSPESTASSSATGTSKTPQINTTATWWSAALVYVQANSLRMLALGFSAGLPLLLVLGTLSFRLREAGLDLSTIGYLSWVGLAYGFKWVWAPLVDRLSIPLLTAQLGRRRSWLLLSQCFIMLGLAGMALNDPKTLLLPVVLCAVLVAFSSATQDIALDAYRIELGKIQEQAALAACYQTGYRLAMIWAGAGVLWIASASETPQAGAYQHSAWQVAYLIMTASMWVGIITVLWSPKPPEPQLQAARNATQWVRETVLAPFGDFVQRYRWQAALILALIAIYRISDVVMGIMANPFYVDMGYTKAEIATVSKVYGVIMTLVGAFIGGILSLRLGVMRVLMLGAVLSAASNLLFVWLSRQGHDLHGLIFVISSDNLSAGIASAAFIAYLSSLTNVRYSATQYALFSSVMLLLPKLLAGYSGVFVQAWGYESFFTATAFLGLPVLGLVAWASKMQARTPAQTTDLQQR